MEKNCLLCLEVNKDFLNYLNVYEAKCGEYNAVSLIAKHLWPVASLRSQSQWLCSMCWKALREFHKFYSRIDDAQACFNHEIKSEHIKTPEYNIFEHDNGTVETIVVKNEVTDEESIGPIDNSKSEFYSTLLQVQKKPRRKYSKKISDVSEEFNDKSSPDMKTNFVADIFKCLICDKLFRNQKVLAKHTAWHKGTVCSCGICDLKFFDLSTLIQHKRVHAPNEKKLKFSNQEETNKSFVNFSCGDLEYMEAEEEQDTSLTPSDSNVFPSACTYCSKVMESQETMENHKAWHKGNVQKCNLCDLKFFNEEKYEIHNLEHKMNPKYIALERRFECKYCTNIYNDKRAYLSHIAWHEDIFYCPICDLKFLSATKFYQHKSSHDLNNKQTFDCNSGGEVSRHEKTQNDVNNPYQNEKLCIKSKKKKSKRGKKSFEVAENIKEVNDNHFQELSEQNDLSLNAENNNNITDAQENEVLSNSDSLQLIEVECTFCCKVLENERVLLNHIAWHEDNIFHCKVCELKFFDKTIYENHYEAHANEVEDSDDNIDSEYFICSICSKVLKSRRQHLNHNAWHVGIIYTCDICDLQFLDKTKYEDHQYVHVPKSWKRCRDCGKPFACARYVKYHWLKMHRNKYIKICDICGMVYRCPDAFKRHTDKHLGQLENNKIPCDICGRLLKGKRSLKIHKRNSHPENGIHPYVCHICLKPIATRSMLTTHINSRHGPEDERHKCLVCDKIFRNISQLKKHSDVHSSEPKYPCTWCSEKFYRSGALTRHRRKVHPKEYEEWKGSLYVKI